MATLQGLWDRFVGGVYRYILEPTNLTPRDVAPFFDRVPEFVTVLVLFYVLTRALLWFANRTVLSPRRLDPMIGQLISKLSFALLMFIGLAVALLVFDLNILNLALTIGLIGAALALGLQNTVANIMGGISLVSDRPFEVGDRVQIGEFWGDVEKIGLRSTRILTTRREYVVIPNRLMDEREIWNYTKEYPELRIDIEVAISYDSDRKLARSLLLKAAEANADVLAFPAPRVLMTGFGASGVELELRCFIPDARRRHFITSDLLEEVQDAFEANHVEIPYPYRTIVYKSELPPPRRAEEGARAELKPLGARRIVAATAGSTPAMNKAQTIANIARKLEADLVIAFITPKTSLVTQREGERAADIFAAAAERAGVNIKLVIREGNLVDAIAGVAEEERCGAVVIGASRTPVLMAWKNAGVEERLRNRLDVPLIVIPPSLAVPDDHVEAARRQLDSVAPSRGQTPEPEADDRAT